MRRQAINQTDRETGRKKCRQIGKLTGRNADRQSKLYFLIMPKYITPNCLIYMTPTSKSKILCNNTVIQMYVRRSALYRDPIYCAYNIVYCAVCI